MAPSSVFSCWRGVASGAGGVTVLRLLAGARRTLTGSSEAPQPRLDVGAVFSGGGGRLVALGERLEEGGVCSLLCATQQSDRANKYLAFFRAVGWANDTPLFHDFHNLGSAVVA